MRVEHRYRSMPPYLIVEGDDAIEDLTNALENRYSFAAIEFETANIELSATQEHTLAAALQECDGDD